MGAGASAAQDDDIDDDKPIVHPGLNQLPSNNDANMEAIAAAQWGRILKHTKQQINAEGAEPGSDDPNDASRAHKVHGLNPNAVAKGDEDLVKMLLDKPAAKPKKKGGNADLLALGSNFARKEQAEAKKTDREKRKDREAAELKERRAQYKNTLNSGEPDVEPAKVAVNSKSDASFISALLSAATKGRNNKYAMDEDPDQPRDLEEEEFVPDVALPPLIMQLKSRNAGSITFIYDVDEEAILLLPTIRDPKDKHKIRDPLYQFEYRLAISGGGGGNKEWW